MQSEIQKIKAELKYKCKTKSSYEEKKSEFKVIKSELWKMKSEL